MQLTVTDIACVRIQACHIHVCQRKSVGLTFDPLPQTLNQIGALSLPIIVGGYDMKQ